MEMKDNPVGDKEDKKEKKDRREDDMDAKKRAELLLDHYKDTFAHILYHWKVRNRLFVYILIVLALMGLDIYKPGALSKVVNGYVEKKIELNEKSEEKKDQSMEKTQGEGKAQDEEKQEEELISFRVVGTGAWFVLLALVVHYYQRSIHVDRQYRYISKLEEKICREMGGDFVTREGKAYKSRTGVASEGGKQPTFIRFVGPLYVYLFPVLLATFVVFGICREGWHPKEFIWYLNIGFAGLILVYNAFYLKWVAFRK